MTKYMIIDFRKSSTAHPLLIIDSAVVEGVKDKRFLGRHITDDLSWSLQRGPDSIRGN